MSTSPAAGCPGCGADHPAAAELAAAVLMRTRRLQGPRGTHGATWLQGTTRSQMQSGTWESTDGRNVAAQSTGIPSSCKSKTRRSRELPAS